MTLHHKIATYHGKQIHEGQEVHAFKTVCGSPILGLVPFKQGQLVAVGPAPHAQCAKCFKAHQVQQGHRVIIGDKPVVDPDRGGFNVNRMRVEGQMLDDKGQPISAPTEKTETIGTAVPDPFSTKTLGVKSTVRDGDRIIKTEINDPMGNLESNEYGS